MAAAAISVFLAGGPPQGSLGIFLALAGLAMIVFPPAVRVGWGIWALAGGLVLCCALAFLPATWFPIPAWRTTLSASPVIKLASTISPTPHETAFWLGVLAASVFTGLFLLSHPLRSSRLIILAASGAAICALYGCLAIFAQLTGWKYLFDGGPTFGFFPNRNHTATLLMTGTLLSLGVLGVAYRYCHWAAGGVATASIAICGGALGLFSESRGGVIFAVVGAAIWMAGLGSEHRDGKRLTYFLVAVAVIGAVFLGVSSPARNRLFAMVGLAHASQAVERENLAAEPAKSVSDSRIPIFQDALGIVRDYPFTGTGLGTFPLVFPQYEKAALSEVTSVHPESDWLMLADEAGLPAVLISLALLVLLFRRISSSRSHPYWPLRWGCIVAAGAALLHAGVDVPLHRVALGWWVLALAGLGFQRGKSQLSPGIGKQRCGFAFAGIITLAFGGQLMRAEWFHGSPLPPFAAKVCVAECDRVARTEEYLKAFHLADSGIAASPLAADLYYEAGMLSLFDTDTADKAETYFQAQRLISPHWPVTSKMQAKVWKTVDPAQAAKMWAETIDRQQRIDKTGRPSTTTAVHLYQDAFVYNADELTIQELLLKEGARGPSFALTAAETANPAIASTYIDKLGADGLFVSQLSPTERVRFAAVWKSRGNAEKLTEFLGAHPEWKP